MYRRALPVKRRRFMGRTKRRWNVSAAVRATDDTVCRCVGTTVHQPEMLRFMAFFFSFRFHCVAATLSVVVRLETLWVVVDGSAGAGRAMH